MKWFVFFRRKLIIPIIISFTTYFIDNSFNTVSDALLIFVIAFIIIWLLDSILGKHNS